MPTIIKAVERRNSVPDAVRHLKQAVQTAAGSGVDESDKLLEEILQGHD